MADSERENAWSLIGLCGLFTAAGILFIGVAATHFGYFLLGSGILIGIAGIVRLRKIRRIENSRAEKRIREATVSFGAPPDPPPKSDARGRKNFFSRRKPE
jgi:hypothetical protein